MLLTELIQEEILICRLEMTGGEATKVLLEAQRVRIFSLRLILATSPAINAILNKSRNEELKSGENRNGEDVKTPKLNDYDSQKFEEDDENN
jgi:hypothetical protein